MAADPPGTSPPSDDPATASTEMAQAADLPRIVRDEPPEVVGNEPVEALRDRLPEVVRDEPPRVVRRLPPTDVPKTDAVARHYDEMDDVYRLVWSDHAHHGYWRTGRESIAEAVDALVDLAADAIGVRGGSRVVDVGSGYGATGRHLADTRDAQVTSVTLSPRQYDVALEADADDPRLHHELGDWLHNALPAGSYDALIAIESIGHMDTGPALAQCFRVLAPGGRLAILDLVAGDHVPRWQVKQLLRAMERESHLTPRTTLDGLRAHLEDAGFVVEQTQDLTRGVRRTWPRALRRLAGLLPRDAAVRRVLFSDDYENRGFLLSIARMTVGYRLGAVRFCLVAARKP